MPELPEVEITRRGLLPAIVGAKVSAVTCRTKALRYPLPRGLEKTIGGLVLREIRRRGVRARQGADGRGAIDR